MILSSSLRHNYLSLSLLSFLSLAASSLHAADAADALDDAARAAERQRILAIFAETGADAEARAIEIQNRANRAVGALSIGRGTLRGAAAVLLGPLFGVGYLAAKASASSAKGEDEAVIQGALGGGYTALATSPITLTLGAAFSPLGAVGGAVYAAGTQIDAALITPKVKRELQDFYATVLTTYSRLAPNLDSMSEARGEEVTLSGDAQSVDSELMNVINQRLDEMLKYKVTYSNPAFNIADVIPEGLTPDLQEIIHRVFRINDFHTLTSDMVLNAFRFFNPTKELNQITPLERFAALGTIFRIAKASWDQAEPSMEAERLELYQKFLAMLFAQNPAS